MRRSLVTLCSIAALALVSAAAVSYQSEDEAAVRAVLEAYMRGHATGDGSHYNAIFHPEAKLFWVRDGQLHQRTSAAYIAGAPGKPAPDEAARKRRIASVDITANAAVGKVELDYPQAKITDYMSMLKIDGEWKIVNKTFTSELKK